MKTAYFRWVMAGGILALSVMAGRALADQTQTTTSSDTLAALLVEVRGLRAAMEQMVTAAPRVQLALGRLQLQEERVNTLTRRLDAVRTAMSEQERGATQMAKQMDATEAVLREMNDPDRRRDAERDLAGLKAAQTRATTEFQRLAAEEAALAQDVAAEQGRWTEINQRLEELERALNRR